jgi:hypothetical protein
METPALDAGNFVFDRCDLGFVWLVGNLGKGKMKFTSFFFFGFDNLVTCKI